MSEAGGLNSSGYSYGSDDPAASSMASSSAGSAHQTDDMSDVDQPAEPVQQFILKELQRVTTPLDTVEDQIASSSVQHSPEHNKSLKLSCTSGYHKKCSVRSSKMSNVSPDSSSGYHKKCSVKSSKI